MGFQRKLATIELAASLFDDNGQKLIEFLTFGADYTADTPDLRDALAKLATFPGAACHTAAERALARLNRGKPPNTDAEPRKQTSQLATAFPARSDAPGVRFERINYRVRLSDGTTVPSTASLIGWMPAGPATDVAWDAGCLYVIKRRGELRLIAAIAPGAVCFDGKYLWAAAATGPAGEQKILVIDPSTEQSWSIGREHGLPPMRSNRSRPPRCPQGM